MSEKQTPRPIQQYRVDRILSEPTKAAIIGDDPGVGKTLVGAETILQGGFKRVLLLMVRDTAEQWSERIALQSDGEVVTRRMESTKPGRAAFADFLAGRDGIFTAGLQWIRDQDWDHVPQFKEDGTPIMVIDKRTGEPTDKQEKKRVHKRIYARIKPVDLLIVDELHIIAANKKSNGRRTLGSIPSTYKLGLSGTAFGGRFENSWSVARWAWPAEVDGSFYRWRDKYCVTETVYVGGGKSTEAVIGEREPGRFVSELPCFIRAEADEQPPDPIIVEVDLTPAQRAQYSALETEMLVWLESHQGLMPLVADLPITLRSRLRTATLGELSLDDDGEIQFAMDCESSKLRALRGILDSPDWTGQPVAIYCDSKKFVKVTVARMRAAGYNAVEWSGDVSSKDRAKIKAAFLAGGIDYLVCVIAAFSTGLDKFQEVCSRVVWLSESDSHITNTQAIARFFRPGRKGEFMHCKIVARDTYDLGVLNSLIMQRLAINASMRTERKVA